METSQNLNNKVRTQERSLVLSNHPNQILTTVYVIEVIFSIILQAHMVYIATG